MRRLKRGFLFIITAILFIAIVHTVVGQFPKSEGEKQSSFDEPADGTYYGECADEEKGVYDVFCKAADAGGEYEYEGMFPEVDYSEVWSYVMYDHPEYAYIPGTLDITRVNGNISVKADVERTSQEDIDAFCQKVDENVIKQGQTEREYVKSVVSYLHETVTYDMDMADKGQNLSDVIEEKRAACTGFSKAVKVILEKHGYTCMIMTGHTDVGYHAWAAVKLSSGKWIYADATSNTVGDPDDLQDLL